MQFTQRIQQIISEHQVVCQKVTETLVTQINAVAAALINCYQHGNKVLCCGNGGSASDAEHFAAEMVNRFQMERANLPAIALTASSATVTAIANDYAYAEVFAKQVLAFAQPGDLLLALSTSGNSPSVVRAIEAAQHKQLRVIAFTGKDGGTMASRLTSDDIELRVPAKVTARIQEMHILLIHIICDLLEQQLFAK